MLRNLLSISQHFSTCWEMLKNTEKFWEMLRNAEKCWEILRNAEKWWEILRGSGFSVERLELDSWRNHFGEIVFSKLFITPKSWVCLNKDINYSPSCLLQFVWIRQVKESLLPSSSKSMSSLGGKCSELASSVVIQLFTRLLILRYW